MMSGIATATRIATGQLFMPGAQPLTDWQDYSVDGPPFAALHAIKPDWLMAAKPNETKQSAHKPRSSVAVSYNEFKEYEGQRYTGMKIGRSHKWYYDKGEWNETKITPDLWQI